MKAFEVGEPGFGPRTPRPAWRRAAGRAAVLLAGAVGAAGCSSGEANPPTYPIRGRVTVGGEPASGAFVVFHPAAPAGAEASPPTAQVEDDGSFALTTYDEADGAPAGDYAVTVEWRRLVQRDGEARPGPNVVPDDYARPETTPLKVTVSPGDNPPLTFPIDGRRARR